MAIYEETIKCRTCEKVKPHTEFAKQKRWSTTQNNVTEHLNSRQCKSCDKHDSKVRRELEKQYPYPQKEICGSCGTDFTNYPNRNKRYLVLDHCHETGIFRNYLCTRCNTSTGGLGDSYERIINRIDFLKPENILKAQNKYRRKDYQPDNNTIKIKPKQKLKVMTSSNQTLDLVKYLIDHQEVSYATKVVDMIRQEYGVTATTPTTRKKKRSSSSDKNKLRQQRRTELKKMFLKSLKEYTPLKNLKDARDVLGLVTPISITNRSEDRVMKYINSGIFYQNPKGTQHFLIDVDELDTYKSI